MSALVAGPASAHRWNGNAAAPTHPITGRHDVSVKSGGVDKTVSLIRSKPDGCSFNTGPSYGPACPAPSGPPPNGASIVDVSAPAFGGTPNKDVFVMLCNALIFAPTDQGGSDDPIHGCDWANARGMTNLNGGGLMPASSGTFFLDGAGNLTANQGNVPADGEIPLTLTSCNGQSGSLVADLLTELDLQNNYSTCTNSQTLSTCPPTPTFISLGLTCAVFLGEFDPIAFTFGPHVAFRTLNMKSPIPSKLCDPPGAPVSFGMCATHIAAGTSIQMTGVRFPCKIIQPDDPTMSGHQGSCASAHSNKQVLVKRSSTGLLEGPAITPTSQTAGVNGDYTVVFTMPNVAFDGELYKMVPHAQDCVFNQGPSSTDPNFPNFCESGKFNAAGFSVVQ